MRSLPLGLALALLVLGAGCKGELSADDGGGAETTESTGPSESEDDGTSSSTSSEDGTSDTTDTTDDTGSDESETGEPECVCEKLDFLLVVDNSASMDDHENDLAAAINELSVKIQGFLDEKVCDFHLGITTTDVYQDNPASCQQLGAFVRTMAFIPLPCSTSAGTPYLTRADLDSGNFGMNLLCMAAVGTGGDENERPMDAMLAAISPELNAEDGCNEGFLRDDAPLVVLVLTDEDDDHADAQGNDGSAGDPADWFAGLVAAKGGKSQNVSAAVLAGPLDPDQCVYNPNNGAGAEPPLRLAQWLELFDPAHTQRANLCDPTGYEDFVDKVANFQGDVACEEFEP